MHAHETRPPVYGPCFSRLYGNVMAVNLFPREKVCSFNCIYCQYGPTERKAASTEEIRKGTDSLAYSPSDVEAALLAAGLENVGTLIVSGRGEPLLCENFAPVVSTIVRLRDIRYRHLKLVLMSNGTSLSQDRLTTIERFDELIFKLDAGDSDTFEAVNVPCRSFTFNALVRKLKMLRRFKIRTAVLAENLLSLRSASYAELVNELHPEELHLYQVDRPVVGKPSMRVPTSYLLSLADHLRDLLTISVRVISHPRARGMHPLADSSSCPRRGDVSSRQTSEETPGRDFSL